MQRYIYSQAEFDQAQSSEIPYDTIRYYARRNSINILCNLTACLNLLSTELGNLKAEMTDLQASKRQRICVNSEVESTVRSDNALNI